MADPKPIRVKIVRRGNEVKTVTTGDPFGLHSRNAEGRIKPLPRATERAKIVPLNRSTISALESNRTYREKVLNNPNIPEWKKARLRAMLRTDI